MKCKFLSVLLALTMILSLLPVTAMAAEGDATVTLPTAEQAKAVAWAPLVDSEGNTDGLVGDHSVETSEATTNEESGIITVPVTIKATDLKAHVSSSSAEELGATAWYFIGLAIPKVESGVTTTYYPEFSNLSEIPTTAEEIDKLTASSATSSFTENGMTYDTIYFSALIDKYFDSSNGYKPYIVAKYSLTDDSGDTQTEYVVYEITWDVKVSKCAIIAPDNYKVSSPALIQKSVKLKDMYEDLRTIQLASLDADYAYPATISITESGKTEALLQYDYDDSADWIYSYDKSTGVITLNGSSDATIEGDLTITSATNELYYATVTLNSDSTDFTYTGSEIKPTVTVVLDGKTLVQDVDYTLSYYNNIECSSNEALAIATGKGKYTGAKSVAFSILQKNITDSMVTLSDTEYTYDGSKKTPTVIVKDGDTVLTKDVNYNVTYSSNINASGVDAAYLPTVTVIGKGNYGGVVCKTFTINKAEFPDELTADAIVGCAAGSTESIDLSSVVAGYLADSESLKYSLSSETTASSTLSLDKDSGVLQVTVGAEGTSSGSKETVDVTVSGFTNYKDAVVKVAITYTSDSIATLGISTAGQIVESKTYDRSKVEVKSSNLTIQTTTSGVVQSVDGLSDQVEYTWSTGQTGIDNGPSDAGNYTLTISLKNGASVTDTNGETTSYAATPLVLSFTIEPYVLTTNNFVYPTVENQVYTGNPIALSVPVSVYMTNATSNESVSVSLTEGVDYEWEYFDNIQVGVATGVVSGINNYSGDIKVGFYIVNATVDEFALNAVVTAPVGGESPVHTGTTTGTNYYIDAVYWEVDDDSAPVDTFVTGVTYRATVSITPNYGYVFDTNADYTGTVNGYTVEGDDLIVDENFAVLIYRFVAIAPVVTPTEPEPETPVEEPTVETPDEVETPESTSTATPEVTVDEETEAVLKDAGLTKDDITELTDSLSTVTVANEETGKDVLSEERRRRVLRMAPDFLCSCRKKQRF